MISPREFIMLHSVNDSVVTLDDANITFGKALEPKKFYTEYCPGHGYCDLMYDDLKSSLDAVFS